MIKTESDMWGALRSHIGGAWRPQRHESHGMGPGIPDLSFVMRGKEYETGWLELKLVEKLKETGNDIRHFTKAQEQWLLEHALLGVPALLLLHEASTGEWFWFSGSDIGFVQGSTRSELEGLATHLGLSGAEEYLKEQTSRVR